ncbi:hypothetical protein V8G54_000960 [Vigna mungo]|uniref:Uncharacterized protein n=1 Tax=Vigna mungo TaxID=3915 RepID=A0AAQ3P7E7_VIGMU
MEGGQLTCFTCVARQRRIVNQKVKFVATQRVETNSPHQVSQQTYQLRCFWSSTKWIYSKYGFWWSLLEVAFDSRWSLLEVVLHLRLKLHLQLAMLICHSFQVQMLPRQWEGRPLFSPKEHQCPKKKLKQFWYGKSP